MRIAALDTQENLALLLRTSEREPAPLVAKTLITRTNGTVTYYYYVMNPDEGGNVWTANRAQACELEYHKAMKLLRLFPQTFRACQPQLVDPRPFTEEELKMLPDWILADRVVLGVRVVLKGGEAHDDHWLAEVVMLATRMRERAAG